MKYLLDTIDMKEITDCLRVMPIRGVTSNPTIIKRQGTIDFFPYFRELKDLSWSVSPDSSSSRLQDLNFLLWNCREIT